MSIGAGRVVLVSGGTRGIGLACVDHLARLGTSVVLTGRDLDSAEAAAATAAQRTDGDVSAAELDQSRADSVAALVRTVHSRHGRLDGLVANAGIHTAGRLGMISDDAIANVVGTNAIGTLRLVQAASKLLRRGSSPAVVLVGSVMGSAGAVGQAAYAMSKAAVHGLVTPAARELASIGCRVNAVAPGYVETEMTGDLDEQSRREVEMATPLGRFARAEEVASVVSFLLSDESSFVTGQIVGVDGGLRG